MRTGKDPTDTVPEIFADLVPPTSPANETSEPTKDGFITAFHRKGCNLRIPLVLRSSDGGDVRKTNTKELHAAILRTAGEIP